MPIDRSVPVVFYGSTTEHGGKKNGHPACDTQTGDAENCNFELAALESKDTPVQEQNGSLDQQNRRRIHQVFVIEHLLKDFSILASILS